MKISIDIKRNELLALHSCVMIVLNNSKEDEEGYTPLPIDPSEAALLLEMLSDIADQHKNTKKVFKMKLKEKQLKPAWHCCNIVLQNKLMKDHNHATDIMVIFDNLAKVIDQKERMNVSPLELV